ncbi:MAG: YhgE/Pip family protein [Bacillota bacterium]
MKSIRRFMQGVAAVIQADRHLFQRFPTLKLAALGMVLLPAIYAVIYLDSVWDPNAKTSALPVGLVNLDSGTSFRGQDVRFGNDVAAALEKQGQFGYQRFSDAASAQQAVRDGKLHFTVLIPKDFSQHVVAGTQPGAAKVAVYASEANNYVGAGLARRFAPELAQGVNGLMSAKRAELNAAGSLQSLAKLKEAVMRLNVGASLLTFGLEGAVKGSGELEKGTVTLKDGALQLQEGTRKLNAGAGELVPGMKQLGAGLRMMDAKKPSNGDLQALADGAHGLAAGEAEFGKSLAQLQGGARQLAGGVRQLKERVPDPMLMQAMAPLDAGAGQLAAGMGKAGEGQARLAEGARRLDENTGKLAAGLMKFNEGIHAMAAKMPEDARIDAFAAGMKQLADSTGAFAGGAMRLNEGAGKLAAGLVKLNEGAATLSAGLQQVDAALPAPGAEGDTGAAIPAGAVQVDLQVSAPVAGRAAGFAPNLLAAALWMGVVAMAFLFHFNRLPASVQQAPGLSKALGKLAVPGVLVLMQVIVAVLALVLLLEVRIPDMPGFGATLAAAAFAYLALLFALVRVFGAAGKGAAILLLLAQLTSAGALMPLELTTGVYHAVQPYLPMTGVVQALRASLSGAAGGAWSNALGLLLLEGAIAFLIAAFAGKWKIVRAEDYRPALDVDMAGRAGAFPQAGALAATAK